MRFNLSCCDDCAPPSRHMAGLGYMTEKDRQVLQLCGSKGGWWDAMGMVHCNDGRNPYAAAVPQDWLAVAQQRKPVVRASRQLDPRLSRRLRGLGSASVTTRANCKGSFQTNSPLVYRLASEDWGTCTTPDTPSGGGGFPVPASKQQASAQSNVQVTVAPTIATQVSPQISPNFVQQFQPTGSGVSTGAAQGGSPMTSSPTTSTGDAANAKRMQDELLQQLSEQAAQAKADRDAAAAQAKQDRDTAAAQQQRLIETLTASQAPATQPSFAVPPPTPAIPLSQAVASAPQQSYSPAASSPPSQGDTSLLNVQPQPASSHNGLILAAAGAGVLILLLAMRKKK